MKIAIIMTNEKKSKIESARPMALHRIIDKPMIEKIVDNFSVLGFDHIVSVVDNNQEKIMECLENKCEYREVFEGDSDLITLTKLNEFKGVDGYTVITQANSPLITKKTYSLLLETAKEYPMVVLTGETDKNDGYDIIIRNPARTLRSIVKYEVANADQRAIREINMNVYVFNNRLLFDYLDKLDQTLDSFDFDDLVHAFKGDGHIVMPVRLNDYSEAIRIETRRDLVYANDWERNRINNYWLDHGVTILDSSTTKIGADVKIGNDTIIHANNIITGKTVIGKNNILESDNKINDSIIGDNNHIERSIINASEMIDKNHVGPWANIRESVIIGSGNRVGSSVELKKVVMEDNNSLAHNVYLGDTTMGSENNIGWGVVTANYNSYSKSKTKIGNFSFIGSSSTIVAPVTIGDKVLVAAGTVVTEDVEDFAMAIARSSQINKENRGKMYLERKK